MEARIEKFEKQYDEFGYPIVPNYESEEDFYRTVAVNYDDQRVIDFCSGDEPSKISVEKAIWIVYLMENNLINGTIIRGNNINPPKFNISRLKRLVPVRKYETLDTLKHIICDSNCIESFDRFYAFCINTYLTEVRKEVSSKIFSGLKDIKIDFVKGNYDHNYIADGVFNTFHGIMHPDSISSTSEKTITSIEFKDKTYSFEEIAAHVSSFMEKHLKEIYGVSIGEFIKMIK